MTAEGGARAATVWWTAMRWKRLGAALVALVVIATGCPRPSPAELRRWAEFVGRVSPVTEERLGLSWRPGCPVGPEDLRLLTLSFWGFDGRGHRGELIVHRDIAASTVTAFRALWIAKFPINRMETVERFIRPDDIGPDGELRANADAPDRLNDTSAFVCRRTTAGRSWSEHAYGRAIDVNPVQNPYVDGSTVVPVNGARLLDRPGTVVDGGVVVAAFTAMGFRWGGHWTTKKDFMHFSPNGR